jgi:serine/threonine-protein kinase HipA
MASTARVQVWTWLRGETGPVIAGCLVECAHGTSFSYHASYQDRADAIPLYLPELPLQPGALPFPAGATLPGAIRDAAPDSWGRRVIASSQHSELDFAEMNELNVLLESGSDRIGAIDFQISDATYISRAPSDGPLAEIGVGVGLVDAGRPLPRHLRLLIRYRCAAGGARPKVTVEVDGRPAIAKFTSATDRHDVVKAEFVTMRLASLSGLNVAPVNLVNNGGKAVLLVDRFDRHQSDDNWYRRHMVSALTILGLDEMTARYASYEDLAREIRVRFIDPKPTLRELFARLVFNVLVGNTDDHARNHAAFWNGTHLSLTPAYDICPQMRSGQEASQAMLIFGNDRMSRIGGCLAAASQFGVSGTEAVEIVIRQLQTIGENWRSVCSDSGLEARDREGLWDGCFLNPYAFTGLADEFDGITSMADRIRQERG